MFSGRVTRVHPWEIPTTKDRLLLLAGEEQARGSFFHHRGGGGEWEISLCFSPSGSRTDSFPVIRRLVRASCRQPLLGFVAPLKDMAFSDACPWPGCRYLLQHLVINCSQAKLLKHEAKAKRSNSCAYQARPGTSSTSGRPEKLRRVLDDATCQCINALVEGCTLLTGRAAGTANR